MEYIGVDYGKAFFFLLLPILSLLVLIWAVRKDFYEPYYYCFLLLTFSLTLFIFIAFRFPLWQFSSDTVFYLLSQLLVLLFQSFVMSVVNLFLKKGKLFAVLSACVVLLGCLLLGFIYLVLNSWNHPISIM